MVVKVGLRSLPAGHWTHISKVGVLGGLMSAYLCQTPLGAEVAEERGSVCALKELSVSAKVWLILWGELEPGLLSLKQWDGASASLASDGLICREAEQLGTAQITLAPP